MSQQSNKKWKEQGIILKKQFDDGMINEKQFNDAIAKIDEECKEIESKDKVIIDENIAKNQFWFVNESDFSKTKIVINAKTIITHLHLAGFRRYIYDGKDEIIQIIDRIIYHSSIPLIQSHLQKVIKNHEDRKSIIEEMIKNHKLLSAKTLYTQLLEFKFNKSKNKDLKNSSLVFFKNGFIKLEKDVPMSELKSYTEYNNYLWEDEIPKVIYNSSDDQRSEFSIFLEHAMNSKERYESACSAIGFLLHRYNIEQKAIYLCDEKMPEDKWSANGRTGKDVFFKAIKMIRPTTTIDGEALDSKQRRTFCFQNVKETDNVIYLADVRKDFDLRSFFNITTVGIEIERKGQAPVMIEGENRPKICISSNWPARGSGQSFTGRLHVIEFADYYSDENPVFKEFGHMFYQDWLNEEYARFNKFMIKCLQFHLDNDSILIPQVIVNYDKQAIRHSMNESAFEFFDNEKIVEIVCISQEQPILIRDIYDEFLNETNDKIDIARFSKFLHLKLKNEKIKIKMVRKFTHKGHLRAIACELTNETSEEIKKMCKEFEKPILKDFENDNV